VTEPPHVRRRLTWGDWLLAAVAALVVMAVLQLVRGHSDWGPSEGVYVLSAHLFKDGHRLYHDLIASQPPWVYLFGAVPLAIHDSLDAVRLACGLAQVVTGLLAAATVLRLTGNRWAAIAAAPLALLTPWAAQQHGLLLPEQLGAPLLLGAALLASQERTAPWAGVLAGIAVFAKWPFVLPAAAIVLASPARGRMALWALGAVAVQAVAFTGIFGTAFWRQTVQAQYQAGHGLDHDLGSWVQGGWNLLPLVLLAAAALWRRAESEDPPLLRTVAAGAAGALLAATSIVKPGTGLNVLVPAEPLLLSLAIPGALWLARTRRWAAAGVAVLAALMLAQSVSTLVSPESPQPFERPGLGGNAWGVVHTKAQMDRLVAQARACPPGAVYAGSPLVAYLAGRHVPDDQPDGFIVSRAKLNAAAFRRVQTAQPRCG
jgi:hypothetical protein